MQRPLTTALGWRLPSWMFDYTPVAFIALEGAAAIGFGVHHRVVVDHPVWQCAWLMVILTALVMRHRSPEAALGLTLTAAVLSGYGPLVMMPVLIALFTMLGVARCLLADPELLILDEPMNGLDPAGIIELREMVGELTGEGRTVFLCSHLLDEVEKTCESVAVIDRGRLVASGPISELVSGGAQELEIGCDMPELALDPLDGDPGVVCASAIADGLRITLTASAGRGDVAAINAKLVSAGAAVFRLEPVRVSLEQRFLDMTSRVGGA